MGSFLIAQWVKNLPERQETGVRFLNREDPLEKEMAIQYSFLENPMDRGPWQATVHGVARVRHDLATKPPPQINPSLLSLPAPTYRASLLNILIYLEYPTHHCSAGLYYSGVDTALILFLCF